MSDKKRYYSPVKKPIPMEDMLDLINGLNTRYKDTGWLSTLIWNTRNAYCAWPEGTFPASQMQMIVEGFLAEIRDLKEKARDAQTTPDQIRRDHNQGEP